MGIGSANKKVDRFGCHIYVTFSVIDSYKVRYLMRWGERVEKRLNKDSNVGVQKLGKSGIANARRSVRNASHFTSRR